MKELLLLCSAACVFPQAVAIKVAAVQYRSTFDVDRNAERIAALLDKLAREKVNVAVFPECALTGYTTGPSVDASAEQLRRAEKKVADACARGRIAAVVGSVHRAGGKSYNAAVVIDEKGALVERYGKLQLAGEKWATPGNHIALFDLAGVKSTVIICHDERYPEFVRLPALAGARMLYYISHESGMKSEHKLAGYRAQIMARAVENRMFAVASNAPGNIDDNSGSHGQSRIVNDDGNVVKEASIYGEDVLIETLRVEPGKLTRPLEGVTGEWWRQGLAEMLKNRGRVLD